MTIEYCIGFCFNYGYNVAGVQNGYLKILKSFLKHIMIYIYYTIIAKLVIVIIHLVATVQVNYV